jgi:DNA-directed RNA polymerase specialized sigma24 family protein
VKKRLQRARAMIAACMERKQNGADGATGATA